MEIVEIWHICEKNATQIMIFLPHYMWAENNNLNKPGTAQVGAPLKVQKKLCYNYAKEH